MKKLEIGPRFEGFLGKDWDTLDIVERPGLTYLADKTDPFAKISDNFYDLIYVSHVLEHIPWYNVVAYLKEMYRILESGGTVEIWVPDFRKIIQVYLNAKETDGWKGPAYIEGKNKKNFLEFGEFNRFMWILGRTFAYEEKTGDENLHKGAFDEEHLRFCLKIAGFCDIKKLDKPRGYDHGWINLGMSGRKNAGTLE